MNAVQCYALSNVSDLTDSQQYKPPLRQQVWKFYEHIQQMHLFDNATPLEETLRSMDDLVRAGKVRYVGASNMTGWQLQKLVSVTRKLGLNPIISLQVIWFSVNAGNPRFPTLRFSGHRSTYFLLQNLQMFYF